MSMSRLNNILAALESEAIAAPIRYQSAMLEVMYIRYLVEKTCRTELTGKIYT